MATSLNSIMFLLIAGLPSIYANHFVLTTSEVQFASVNDSVTLRCTLSYKRHLPESVKIQWFDGPLAVTARVNGVTMKYSKTNAKLESQLIISGVKEFHFGQYKCEVNGIEGQSLTASTHLMPRGTNYDGRNLITNINLTHPGQVLLKCNNIPSENKNKVSWQKVHFNQTVISLDVNTDSFNDTVTSLSGTGKFICYNNDTVFHITYVYPQGYQPLRFTEKLVDNATLLYNNTDPILVTCTVPLSMTTTKLYWMLNNEVITTDLVKRVNVPNVIHKDSELELQLIISSPIPRIDNGIYTCVAENEWERIERRTSIKFDISNADPYNIVSFSSEQYMIDGSQFTASCVISRLSKATYLNVFMLYSNGLSMVQLVDDDNTIVQYTIEDYIVIATVTIKNASINNNGTYLCYATAGFAGKSVMQSTTTQFIERPVEIVNYYKDPIEQHSITCKAHIFITTSMNSTSIQFTHHTAHHQHDKAVVYHPTSTVVNETEMSITAHLDLKIVHGQRYHGVYECITSASISDKLYSDSKSLAVEQATKKHTAASVLAFSVHTSTDQSLNDASATNTIYLVAGVTVFVVATAVLLVVVVHLRLRRSRHNLSNTPQFV